MKKLLFAIAITAFLVIPFNGRATVEDEIASRNKQIEELQKQIDDYQKQILETGSKAKTLSNEITRLNAQINKMQLEIKSLGLAINQTDSEIDNTEKGIEETELKIELQKKALADAIVMLYQADNQNLVEILSKNERLSDFFDEINQLDELQNTMKATIVALRSLKSDLEGKQDVLQEKKSELFSLKSLQESQKSSLDKNKSAKNQLLQQTKGEEKKYQLLLNQSKQQLKLIQEQITYLNQSGVTVEDAIKYGQLAAIATGMRPAFLIAILEVESRLGQNVGSGNWKDDMYLCYLRLGDIYPSKKAYYTKRAEDEKAAFFKIATKLGLDPDTVKVSKEPSYGCGGAMGPAQFLPTTWLGYESQVMAMTGHNPVNPWNIQDAFAAAAIKLSKTGAADGTKAGEIRAAKAYISGNANCTSSICNYYANLAQDKAAIIEQNL